MKLSPINRRENSGSTTSKHRKPKLILSEAESYPSPIEGGNVHRSSKFKCQHRGVASSFNVFYSFLMGAGLATQKEEYVDQDEVESFVFVNTPDRFGLYDSTDTEISELKYPVKEPVSRQKEILKESIRHPNEIFKESVSYPKEIAKKFVSHPKEIIKESVSYPKEITKKSVSHPKDIIKESVSYPKEITKKSVSHPKENIEESVNRPRKIVKEPVSRSKKVNKQSVIHSKEIIKELISRSIEETSKESCLVSKDTNENKEISIEGSSDGISPESSRNENVDAASTVISVGERFVPNEVISANEKPDVGKVNILEGRPYISRIISIENRFGPVIETSTVSVESVLSPGEEISSKEESAPSEETISDSAVSSRSTRSSEEIPQQNYKNKPDVYYRVNIKNQISNQKKYNQVNYKNPNVIVQQALTTVSSHDIYYTPESSATKELEPLKKETEPIKRSVRPEKGKTRNIKRTESVRRISTIEEEIQAHQNDIKEDRVPEVKQVQKLKEVETKQRPRQPAAGRLNESTKEKLSRLLGSQMSNDRKRSSSDKHNSRYSRDPPERDQNYDDSLMKKNHPQSSEIHQGGKSCCTCKNADDCRRLNHQQYLRKYHPEQKKRTTYDLVKSAENLRQQGQEQSKNPCVCPGKSKQGHQSQSSPEVSRNKQNMKSEDPCNADACEYYSDYAGKNEGYGSNQMERMKPRKYPYEEPLTDNEYNNENHDRNCPCDHCNRRNRYRNCRCCNCVRNDDQISNYSDDSQCNLNLAYQKSEDYPDLVDEIENSISRRNKERVKKTMRQFEMLSRQNKGLEKPIYDDEEEDVNVNRFPFNKRTCPVYNRPRSREAQYYNNQKPRPPCCYDRRNYQTKSECLSEHPAFSATPFPRTRGYVEKVARYMDPSMTETAQKYPRYRPECSNSHWQMDPRSGEWVKVYDDGGYDFENNYPPLPAPPPVMYRDYENYHKSQGNPNFFNIPSPYRTHGAFKRSDTPTKQCRCRNCMQPPPNGNNRY